MRRCGILGAHRTVFGLEVPVNFKMSDGRTRAAVELARKIHREGYIPELEVKQRLLKRKKSAKTANPAGGCFIDAYCRQPKASSSVKGSINVEEKKNHVAPFFCVAAATPAEFIVSEVLQGDTAAPVPKLTSGTEGEDGSRTIELLEGSEPNSNSSGAIEVNKTTPAKAPISNSSSEVAVATKKHSRSKGEEQVVVIQAKLMRIGCTSLQASRKIENAVNEVLHGANTTATEPHWSVRVRLSSSGFNEGSYITSHERVWITLRSTQKVRHGSPNALLSRLQEHFRKGIAVQTSNSGPELASDDVLLTADENPYMQRAKKKLEKKRVAAVPKFTGSVKLRNLQLSSLDAVRKPRVDAYRYDVQVTRIRPPSMRDAKRAGPDALENIKESVRLLRQDGFLNYFAHERFHEFTRRDAHPGLHLLRGEFRAAASAMVHTPKAEKRSEFANRQATSQLEALENRPNAGSIAASQKMLREALAFCSDEDAANSEAICEETFRSGLGLAFCTQLVGEFSSCMWNRLLTRRVRLHGSLSVVEGDLIMLAKNSAGAAAVSTTSPSTFVTPAGKSVFVATKEHIESGAVTARDVVLPIPGLGTSLPQNETRDALCSIMDVYGLALNPETLRWDAFSPHHNAPTSAVAAPRGADHQGGLRNAVVAGSASTRGNVLGIRFQGGYRHMIHVPNIYQAKLQPSQAITWKHDDPRNKPKDDDLASAVEPLQPNTVDTLTLDLGFELPVGVYSSMLIRELCKMEGNIAPSIPLDDLSRAMSRLPDATKHHSSLEALQERNARNLLQRKRRKLAEGGTASLHYALVQQTILKNRGPTKRSILADMSGPKSVM